MIGRDPVFDGPCYRRRVPVYVVVGEPQEADAQAFEALLALQVFQVCIGVVVAGTVYFNGKEQVLAEEVNHVFVDGALPVEVVAQQLLVLQMIPQHRFGPRQVAAELPGQCFQPWVIGNDLPGHTALYVLST